MTSKSAPIALALGLAAAAFLLAPSRALAAHDEPAGEEAPPVAPETVPEQPPPVRIEPPEPSFVTDGFYYGFTLEAGVAPNFATDADFDVGADWVDGVGFEAGFRVGIFRLEAELGLQNTQVSSLKLGAASPFPTDDYAGSMLAGNLMANLYIESPVALFGSVRPYVGWGHGFSAVHARYTEATCSFGVCSPDGNDVVNDADRARSRQFMAGLTIASDAPGAEIFVGYRYLEMDDLELKTVGNVRFIQDGAESHALLIGVRIRG